jgi:hypothetical protein
VSDSERAGNALLARRYQSVAPPSTPLAVANTLRGRAVLAAPAVPDVGAIDAAREASHHEPYLWVWPSRARANALGDTELLPGVTHVRR